MRYTNTRLLLPIQLLDIGKVGWTAGYLDLKNTGRFEAVYLLLPKRRISVSATGWSHLPLSY